MAVESTLTDAGGALISATEGRYILVLLTFLVILFTIIVLVVVKYLIYDNPKNWERAMDSIVGRMDKMVEKLDFVMQRTDLNCQIFTAHDKQAGEIKTHTLEIPHIKDTCDETKTSVVNIEKCLIGMKANGKLIDGGRRRS